MAHRSSSAMALLRSSLVGLLTLGLLFPAPASSALEGELTWEER